MSENDDIPILPYTRIIGQDQLKLALELSNLEPRISGILISGERGTGKSTIVRAFAKMVYGHLPITIPINATEDRVVGGWQINELVHGEAKEQIGLLEEADKKLLYVDEVNLLDDHIVNIILDVTSTGVLVIQREGLRKQRAVQFTLIGTMNPEEGSLRPQLLDRFGLMVRVTTNTDPGLRHKILRAVLDFDEVLFQQNHGISSKYNEDTREEVEQYRIKLEKARSNVNNIEVSEDILECCATIADKFHTEGHRTEHLLVLASRACAARNGQNQVTYEHIKKVASLVLQHRRPAAKQLNRVLWNEEDEDNLNGILVKMRSTVSHD